MSVRAVRSGTSTRDDTSRRRVRSLRSRLRANPDLTPQLIGELLGLWRDQELRLARGFRECRGLSTEQLEDIYQETALALYSRQYKSEEHLRNALLTGLKHRSLRLHRDERRRRQILARSAPGLRLMAQASEEQNAPEPVALAHEDRLIASEFMTELDTIEKRVFSLLAENMQYRAIAPVLGIPVNQARNSARSCARKRERFQLLYDTGRLCGYRARTIQALQTGEATSDELAERAFAHLESCAHCRAEHKTNAKRLRRSFYGHAAALLPPMPALLGHAGWLTRLGIRFRTLQHRLRPDGLPFGQGAIRERAAVLLAGGGAVAKTASGVATIVVIAAGTIRATHALDQKSARQHRGDPPSIVTTPPVAAVSSRFASTPFVALPAGRGYPAPRSSHHSRRLPPGHVVSIAHRPGKGRLNVQREPEGFAYLGVPAKADSSSAPTASHAEAQTNGGPFSP